MTDKKALCLICKKSIVADHKPFCSTRCQMIDLGHWFDESYSVPSNTASDELTETIDHD